MSAERRRRVIEWWDQAGNRYTDVSRTAVRTLGSIPFRDRLVMANDDQGHLVAVLVGNGEDAPPVVMVRGAQGPTPLLLLLEGGLGAALVFDGRIGSLGGPREHFEVDCPECPAGFVLHAGQLKAAMQQRPKRTPCVVLTRAVAAHR